MDTLQDKPCRKLCIATRVHGTHGSGRADLEARKWCEAISELGHEVLIAADTENYQSVNAIAASYGEHIRVLHVSPWCGYSQPLNIILTNAASTDATHLLLSSLEVRITAQDLAILCDQATEDTLVVGGQLTENHGDAPGEWPINGLNTPWNTLALWNISLLRLVGFLPIADGGGAAAGGLEEVATISLLQWLRPKTSRAVLVKLPNLRWTNDLPDPKRLEYHRTKLETKLARGECRLSELGIPRGQVLVL